MTDPRDATPAQPTPTDAPSEATTGLGPDVPDVAPEVDQEDGAAMERVLRAGLVDFDLDEADLALLDLDEAALDEAAARGPLPVVAVIGPPNVGKATPVTRILRRPEAVVEDLVEVPALLLLER